MAKFQSWVSAARLRTLPLSVSVIIVGTGIALKNGDFNILILILALGTTLGLQILSNFANDYGDGVKGTDNEDRIGPLRAIQSGLISRQEMKKGIYLTAGITLVITLLLIYISFGDENFVYAIIFFLLGIGAIVAAIKYTVGSNAYGYRGLGDIFVFIFFGLVAVYGSYFLYSQVFNWLVFLPAIAIGFLSAGVLNLNNMRDIESDTKAGKNTLVVKLGQKKSLKYHFALILCSILCFLLFSFFTASGVSDFLYVPAFIPLLLHLRRVANNNSPVLLDPELKILALTTFLISVLFIGGIII